MRVEVMRGPELANIFLDSQYINSAFGYNELLKSESYITTTTPTSFGASLLNSSAAIPLTQSRAPVPQDSRDG